MHRVLMPVDADEQRTLKQAEYVASLPDAANSVEVILLFVFQGEAEEMPEELKQFGTATRIGSVRRASEYFEERDIEVRIQEDSGDTAKDILELAEREDVDSIVLGGRKRSPTSKLLFGSISQTVLLESDRPVTVTGGGE